MGPDDIIAPEARLSPSERKRARTTWRDKFLETLAETSNVTAARLRVHISSAHIYRTRRTDPEFADLWMEALCEGYDNLEKELLCRMRSGESRDAKAAKFDNVSAIRLLAMHRASVERGRARRAHDDEQATLESIDALFRQMRERRAANAAILLDHQRDQEDEA